MSFDPSAILSKKNLRNTKPRQLVLKALASRTRPLLHKDVHRWIEKRNGNVNLVTVYRILERFEELGIAHKHPSSGGYVLCSLPDTEGHHGFLSCDSCGKVEEFADAALCKQENRIAKQAKFKAKQHVSDILGSCASCSA